MVKKTDPSVSLEQRLGKLLAQSGNEEHKMPDMECPQPSMMAAWVADSLNEDDQQTMETHLVQCGVCREWLGELCRMEEEFPDFENLKGGFAPATSEESKTEAQAEEPNLRLVHSRPGSAKESKRKMPVFSPRGLALAASLVLVLGLSWILTDRNRPGGELLDQESLNASVFGTRLEAGPTQFQKEMPPLSEAFSVSAHPQQLAFQSGRVLTFLVTAQRDQKQEDLKRMFRILSGLHPQAGASVSEERLKTLFGEKQRSEARLQWIAEYEKGIDPESRPYLLLGAWSEGARLALKQKRWDYFRAKEIQSLHDHFQAQDELPGLLVSLEQLELLSDGPGKETAAGPYVEALENLFLIFE